MENYLNKFDLLDDEKKEKLILDHIYLLLDTTKEMCKVVNSDIDNDFDIQLKELYTYKDSKDKNYERMLLLSQIENNLLKFQDKMSDYFENLDENSYKK